MYPLSSLSELPRSNETLVRVKEKFWKKDSFKYSLLSAIVAITTVGIALACAKIGGDAYYGIDFSAIGTGGGFALIIASPVILAFGIFCAFFIRKGCKCSEDALSYTQMRGNHIPLEPNEFVVYYDKDGYKKMLFQSPYSDIGLIELHHDDNFKNDHIDVTHKYLKT